MTSSKASQLLNHYPLPLADQIIQIVPQDRRLPRLLTNERKSLLLEIEKPLTVSLRFNDLERFASTLLLFCHPNIYACFVNQAFEVFVVFVER